MDWEEEGPLSPDPKLYAGLLFCNKKAGPEGSRRTKGGSLGSAHGVF